MSSISPGLRQFHRSLTVADLGLHPHEFDETLEKTRHPRRVLLEKRDQFLEWAEEGVDVEGKGDEVPIVHGCAP